MAGLKYPELTDSIKEELDSRLQRFHKGEGKDFSLKVAKSVWAEKRNPFNSSNKR